MSTTILAPADLRELLDEPDAPLVLDVRTPSEYQSVHVPGSWNVPLDLLREHARSLAAHVADQRDRRAVLVCRSGARAAQAEEVLSGTGLEGLRVLDGGINAWQSAGGPVERGRATWDLERQVRLVAGSVVATSVATSAVVPRARWVAAAIGTGLTVAALTDTCAMGMALARMPWNRTAADVDIDDVLRSLADA